MERPKQTEIKSWKTECILFGSKPQLAKYTSANLDVCGKKVEKSTGV